ncbi:hypothetical protein EVAR_92779_1 [Eumeta japonica]|uniref:Uncharacterized protein n=1 Tax=Eumeta variegata TaxID=151549 RepID=A0A4C1SY53_EUMVA|nr:hypothetical protein EVAR_92779_1 [Eumeta japonica]
MKKEEPRLCPDLRSSALRRPTACGGVAFYVRRGIRIYFGPKPNSKQSKAMMKPHHGVEMSVTIRSNASLLQHNARNFAAVKFVTKAPQWRKIETRRRRQCRGA